MHRPTLLFGLLLIVIMCLFPPVRTGPIDGVADAIRGEEVRKVEYHPVWTLLSDGEEEGPLSALQNSEVAGKRLLLQILVVALLAGGTAFMIGPSEKK